MYQLVISAGENKERRDCDCFILKKVYLFIFDCTVFAAVHGLSLALGAFIAAHRLCRSSHMCNAWA